MPPKKKKKAAAKATPKPSKSNKTKNSKSSATASTDNKTFPFLRLPLEVRRMIYRFALAAPELEIGERRTLRRDSVANRYNRFTLVNFTIDHFSLLRLSKQIRAEVQESGAMTELSFKITSTVALEGFLGYRIDYPGEEEDKIDDQIFDLLQKAKSIEIHLKKGFNHWSAPMGTVGWLGTTLEDPMKIKLVDSAGKEKVPDQVFNDAVARWKRFAETL